MRFNSEQVYYILLGQYLAQKCNTENKIDTKKL